MDNILLPTNPNNGICEECEILYSHACVRLGTLIVGKVDDTRELPLHCPSVKTDCPGIVLVLPHMYLSVPTTGSLGHTTV